MNDNDYQDRRAKDDMRIFIPTRGRMERRITVRYMFVEDLVKDGYLVDLVVPECEAEAWKRNTSTNFVGVHVVPDSWEFSDIRQGILEGCAGDLHFVVDDDLYFYRRTGDGVKLRKSTYQDIKAMIRWISLQYQRGTVHGGISMREGNNRLVPYHQNGDYVRNTRVCRAHFYRPDVLRTEGFDFRDVRTKQDFHCTLSLLELGYPNHVSVEFAQNQAGSNSTGGCSRYRTKEVMDDGAHRLHELHPESVTVVEKETLGAWGGGVRTDVRCAWKKAFMSRSDERRFQP